MTPPLEGGKKPRKAKECQHQDYNFEKPRCPDCGKPPTVSEKIRLTLKRFRPSGPHGVSPEWETMASRFEQIAKEAEPKVRKKADAVA